MKKYKGFIIGGLVGASLMFSAQSFAAIGEKAEAIFSQFNFVINGQAKTLDESPVVINGNSYLPVRSISNALGYDVTYKADSRTIELNNGVGGANTSAKPQAQEVKPQAQANPVSSEDKYAGKVFVTGADLYQKLQNEYTIITGVKDGKNTLEVNGKSIVLNPSDYFYNQEGTKEGSCVSLTALQTLIPSEKLANLPKYTVINNKLVAQ